MKASHHDGDLYKSQRTLGGRTQLSWALGEATNQVLATPEGTTLPCSKTKMLCRLHLTAPHSPLRSRALWPRAGSLFDELEREMDSLWDLLSSNWPTMSSSSSSSSSVTSRETVHSSDAAKNPTGMFLVTQDMAGFDPKELVVKLVGAKVVLTGKKATQTPNGPFRYELFRREWDVPENVDRESLSCSISSEGELRIEAPSWASQPATRTVPIEVNGAQAEPETGTPDNSRAKA